MYCDVCICIASKSAHIDGKGFIAETWISPESFARPSCAMGMLYLQNIQCVQFQYAIYLYSVPHTVRISVRLHYAWFNVPL